MSTDNTSKLDIAPLTIIVSESLDPRVRRKMEAEQQADVKTYQEMSDDMQSREDLNKIKQEVGKDNDETDPFKTPGATEDEKPTPDAATPEPAANPAPAPAAATPAAGETNPPADAAKPAAATPAPADTNAPATTPAPAPADATATAGDDADLESAFESHGTNLPKDLIRRVLKNYIKLESGDHDVGSLDHIKIFVYIDLAQNGVSGDTLESVQSLRDPENTIIVIKEDGSPNADVTLRVRSIADTLSKRGAKVFYDLDSATSYLNDLFDVISGRNKGDK